LKDITVTGKTAETPGAAETKPEEPTNNIF
jgi:hypothetical protein